MKLSGEMESERLQDIYERLDEMDAATAETKAAQLLHGLGKLSPSLSLSLSLSLPLSLSLSSLSSLSPSLSPSSLPPSLFLPLPPSLCLLAYPNPL